MKAKDKHLQAKSKNSGKTKSRIQYLKYRLASCLSSSSCLSDASPQSWID